MDPRLGLDQRIIIGQWDKELIWDAAQNLPHLSSLYREMLNVFERLVKISRNDPSCRATL
jgi:hypothetical protein